MIRPTSQLIFCLFLEQFEDFLPTYSANGEVEVWRNTPPRLVVGLDVLGETDTPARAITIRAVIVPCRSVTVVTLVL